MTTAAVGNVVVSTKTVEVGDIRDGLRVIRSGLAPTDQVVVNGNHSAAHGSVLNLGCIRNDADAPGIRFIPPIADIVRTEASDIRRHYTARAWTPF